MNKYFKTSIYFMIFALLIQLVPIQVLAESNTLDIAENEFAEVMLFSDHQDGSIELFEDENGENLLTSIPDGTSASLIEANEEYSLISYTIQSEEDSIGVEDTWTGYVQSIHIIAPSNLEDFLEKRTNEDFKLENYYELNFEGEPVIDPDDFKDDSESADNETVNSPKVKSEVAELEEQIGLQNMKAITGDLNDDNVNEIETFSLQLVSLKTEESSTPRVLLNGVALLDSTNVYSEKSKNSKVLRSYKQGHILLFWSHDTDWYEALVYVDGKAQNGYIHKKDVDLIQEKELLKGYAIVQPVNIYTNPTRNSAVLKSYNLNSALIYFTFSSQWYEALVYVNGKAHTGYIHAKDVGDQIQIVQTPLKGIASANTVNVYSTTSRNATKLRSYNKGHILLYRTYSSEWHEAIVIINGKAQTGYIHVNDVENATQSPIALRGIALKSSTRVYSSASTSSRVLRSYNEGHILQYRTFTSGWYEATVIINGKAQTGYIHANDVETASNQQNTINGFGAKSPTNIYASATNTSRVLKSYRKSQKMMYRTFSANWYEATVILNGKAHTGYIHKNDVTLIPGKIVVLDPGHGGTDPGARASGIVEKELNLDIALRTKKLLESAGITVIMTRSTDVFLPLADRAKIANTSNADIFISIHGNAFNGLASGTETFWYGKYERLNSILLANILQNNVVKSTGIPYRRVAEGNFHVLRETEIPSALVEVGFIDNPSDAAKLKQSKYRQLAAEGILNGVLEYFK